MPPSANNTQASRWCFTINNPTPNDEQALANLPNIRYLIYGRERGQDGTFHFQGFVIFERSIRFNRLHRLLPRAHLEAARGSSQQARDYCKKDGDFTELGEFPAQQGRRSDLDAFVEWCKALEKRPTAREIADAHPTTFFRFERNCWRFVDLYCPVVPFCPEEEEPRPGWQADLWRDLERPAHQRQVIFIVDHIGDTGKSWFCSYVMDKKPDETQVLGVGRVEDMAYAVDPHKSIFLLDVPRSRMEYFQYSILEMLKDRRVMSTKYESKLKRLDTVPHVVVFCNEQPDRTKLSYDRYHVVELN